MKLRKLILLLLTLALVLCTTGTPATADYIGPLNRKRVTTSTQHLRVCYNSSGKVECTCVSDGGECDATSNPCPNSRCVSCDEQTKTITKEEPLPAATVSGSFTCAGPGTNGWCRSGPNMAFSASEPVAGYLIQRIEGSPGAFCDPADASNISCNWTPPEGQSNLEYWAHSTFGDTSLKGTATIYVDSGNPGLTLSVPAPNGQNGWFVSPVSISASASDGVSGVASTVIRIDSGAWQAGPVTVTAQGAHTAQAQATDRAGNTATSNTASFKLDTVLPELAVSASAPDGQNGWFITAPTISVSGSDATSGLAAAELQIGSGSWQTGSVSLSTDGSHALNFRARDNAGNQKTAGGVYPVDMTDPTLAVNLQGTAGQNGWYRSAVSASPSASDATSGLATLDARLDNGSWRTAFPISIGEGVHTLDSRASDKAGNQTSRSQSVKVDVTPPSLTAIIPPVNGQNGWYVSTPALKVTGTDALSGLTSAQLKINNGAWIANEGAVTTEGTHTITFQTTDVAGNITTQTANLKVDLQGPQLLLDSEGTSGQNGWFTSASVEVSAAASDAFAGVEKVEAQIDKGSWQSQEKVTVTGDGTHEVTFRAIDKAGNVTLRTMTVQIDAAPPKIDVTIDALEGLNEWFRSAASVLAKATDESSGVKQMDIRLDKGDWQPVSSVKIEEDGIHQVGFRAVDGAGNRTTLERTVKIDQHDPIGTFLEPVGMTKVQGQVTVNGLVKDNLSGIEQVDFSYDDGKTWAKLPVKDEQWNTSWDSLQFPGGQHAIQAKFTDQAGNTSSAKLMVIIANALPQIDLTERWYIWEKGLLDIIPGDLQLMDVTIDISDPQGRWPDVHHDYSPNKIPSEIVWDRKFGKILAPIGEYNVTVTVTDQMAQQVVKHAVIVIPPVPTPTNTQTATVTATIASTARATATQRATATRTQAPTATATVVPVIAPVTPEPVKPPQSPVSLWPFVLWLLFLTGMGVMLMMAVNASRDPRPKETRKLAEAITRLPNNEEL